MPGEPKEPIYSRLLVSETTVAALGVLLKQSPRGLLLVRDELSGWVASFDAYKNTRGADLAHWLEFHRGGPLIIDRKNGPVHENQPVPPSYALVGRCSRFGRARLRVGQEWRPRNKAILVLEAANGPEGWGR